MSPANSGKRTPARRGLIPCKRKRRPSATSASDAAMVEESISSPWASLDEDIVRLIAGRVLAGDIAEYLRFRAVCPHWRSSTVCPRGRSVVDPRFHPRHWMMLPEGYRLYPGHTKLRGWVRFFNLRTGAFVSVRLPLFRDHFALDSVDGLLLLQRDHDMAVRLLHPFTGDVVELPSLATLLPQLKAHFHPIDLALMKEKGLLLILRQVCAAVSFSPDGVITAMLALTSNRVPRVAFATSEDQQWTLSSWETEPRMRILSSQGRLYMITYHLQFLMVEPPQQEGKKNKGSTPTLPSLPPPKLITTTKLLGKIYSPIFLAECDSDILLVGSTDRSRLHVLIYRLADIIMGRLIPLKCLGGNSLFVMKRSICVSSKAHPTLASDTVVCVHHSFNYLGQYHLRSGTWSTATDGDALRGPIPSPYTFTQHIYTCCDRYFWNKGRIYCPHPYPTWGAKTKWRFGG